MTSSIQISRAENPADVPFERLVEILLAAFAFQDGLVDPPSSAKSVSVSELQWRFARDALFLAHDRDGNVIGQIWIEDIGKDAYLYKLSVDPAIKGGGIGKALVEAACAFARSKDKEKMRLHVRVELEGNIAFFKAQGFEIAGAGVHDGYDRTIFWKMARDLTAI